MLVLTRRVGEEIVIDNDIRVMVVAINGDKVRIGIDAPASVRVDRKEVHERRGEAKTESDRFVVAAAPVWLADKAARVSETQELPQ